MPSSAKQISFYLHGLYDDRISRMCLWVGSCNKTVIYTISKHCTENVYMLSHNCKTAWATLGRGLRLACKHFYGLKRTRSVLLAFLEGFDLSFSFPSSKLITYTEWHYRRPDCFTVPFKYTCRLFKCLRASYVDVWEYPWRARACNGAFYSPIHCSSPSKTVTFPIELRCDWQGTPN